ncbi:hypothetical protein SDC9_163844 [bioreactor metagenome]|uniref:Uncharacterized protein n=1 Tax=bioreactor metagenome TaxID=1076179 RepID=A0A645FRH9_9ZZZZ
MKGIALPHAYIGKGGCYYIHLADEVAGRESDGLPAACRAGGGEFPRKLGDRYRTKGIRLLRQIVGVCERHLLEILIRPYVLGPYPCVLVKTPVMGRFRFRVLHLLPESQELVLFEFLSAYRVRPFGRWELGTAFLQNFPGLDGHPSFQGILTVLGHLPRKKHAPYEKRLHGVQEFHKMSDWHDDIRLCRGGAIR